MVGVRGGCSLEGTLVGKEEKIGSAIVVAVQEGGPILCACLTALEAQISGIAAELLVVVGTKSGTAADWSTHPGSVRILQLPVQPDAPTLWQAAIAAPRGGIITLFGESCVPRRDRGNQEIRATKKARTGNADSIDL